MAQSEHLYALLVGINEYDPEAGVRSLRGCINDVRAMAHLLTQQFGVPAHNILTLVNEAATAGALQQAFHSHLIARSKAWTKTQDDATRPAFLFYFSGHGSQARDLSGIEPDGMDETLVLYDSRTPGVYDVRDWELADWLAQLNEATDEVTVILDACHSGSGTRDDDLPRVRACPPDVRPSPRRRPLPANLPANLPPGAETRAVTALDGIPGRGHVLFAGCRDRELAREHAVVPADAAGDVATPPVWRGALSYFLQQVLSDLPPDRAYTNRELLALVRSRVSAVYPSQTPQCEGDLDRDFLGSVRREQDPFFTVTHEADGLYWVDAGLVHGVGAGSILRVYPPHIRQRADAPAPLALLEVAREGVDRSGCRVISVGNAGENAPESAGGNAGENDGAVVVPPLARAEVERLGRPGARRGVRVELASPHARVRLADRLAARAGTDDLSPWLRVVAQGADLLVTQSADGVQICDRSGDRLAGPYAAEDMETVAQHLAHIARFRNALELRNDAPGAPLTAAVTLEIKRLQPGSERDGRNVVSVPLASAPSGSTGSGTGGSTGGEPTVEAGTRLVFEITNRSRTPLYVALFALTGEHEVYLVWPRTPGAHEALMPGKTMAIGRSSVEIEQLEATLSPGTLEARDLYKVIASTQDVNFALLQQGPLHAPFVPPVAHAQSATRGEQTLNPLEQMLASAIGGAPPQAMTRSEGGIDPRASTPAIDEWTTVEHALTVVAAPVTHEQRFPAADAERTVAPEKRAADANETRGQTESSDLGGVLRVTPPAQCNGIIRLLSARQALHLRGADALALPPGLAPFPEVFAPVDLHAKRGVRTGASVIEIDCDEPARKAITPATPLLLHFPPQDGALALIAVAHDGSAFYPVGRADGSADTLAVEWLPQPEPVTAKGTAGEGTAAEAGSEPAQAGVRRVTRLVRLYLFRILEQPVTTLGLFNVRFVPAGWVASASRALFARRVAGGELRYTAATPLRVNERVALVLHGVGDHSAQQVVWLNHALQRLGVQYDRIIALEYEGIGTGIAENAETLAAALRAIGVRDTAGVALDIFAHGMGALIARYYIEVMGNDRFVRNAIFAGPPNLGTPLADAALLIPWLVALSINLPLPSATGILFAWALGTLAAEARGLADLGRSAAVLAELNRLEGSSVADAAARKVQVRYHVLAGNATRAGENTPSAGALHTHDADGIHARMMRKLAEGLHDLADWYFEGDNDLVVSVRSSIGLHVAHAPGSLLLTRILRCHHFGYFESEAATVQVARWLRSDESGAIDTAPEVPIAGPLDEARQGISNGATPFHPVSTSIQPKKLIIFRHPAKRQST